MTPLSGPNFDLTNTFWWIDLFLSAAHFAIFSIILYVICKRPTARHFSSLVSCGMYFILSMVLLLRSLFYPVWHDGLLETFLAMAAGMPVILFILIARHSTILGLDMDRLSADRFDRLKDEFLTVASHELRTPLSVINGFAEILVREKLGILNDEQKRRMRKILMQGQRLNRIIDELLDLSRIRSGKIEVRQDVFDIVPVLKSCLDDQQIVCEQQNIKLTDQIPDWLPDVKGDLERVTQVVINLLSNAIKYTTSGGGVVLSAFHNEKEKFVQIVVKDTGIGIDPKEQPRIFEEFYRSQHQHVRKFSGSGLGLAIVQQLVMAQGGTVGVESEGFGKGSLFYFTLPVSAKQLSRPEKPAASNPSAQSA